MSYQHLHRHAFDLNQSALRTTEVLKEKDYLVENRFSAADVVTGGVLLWAQKLGMLKEDNPVQAYMNKLMERPAFKKADEDFYAKID